MTFPARRSFVASYARRRAKVSNRRKHKKSDSSSARSQGRWCSFVTRPAERTEVAISTQDNFPPSALATNAQSLVITERCVAPEDRPRRTPNPDAPGSPRG